METGLSVEPDVVLVGLFLNDAYHSPVLDVKRLPAFLSWSHFVRLMSWRLDVLRNEYVYEDDNDQKEEVIERERERFVAKYSLPDRYAKRRDDWRSDRNAIYQRVASSLGDWGYAWTEGYWERVVPILELMKEVGRDHDFEVAVLFFPIRMQVQSEHLADEPQRSFARHMKELRLPHLDILPILREKYERDQEDVFYDHAHYRFEGHETFADDVAQFLLSEVIEP